GEFGEARGFARRDQVGCVIDTVRPVATNVGHRFEHIDIEVCGAQRARSSEARATRSDDECSPMIGISLHVAARVILLPRQSDACSPANASSEIEGTIAASDKSEQQTARTFIFAWPYFSFGGGRLPPSPTCHRPRASLRRTHRETGRESG